MRLLQDITDESGASAVELVIAVPIVLMLACALLDGAQLVVSASQAQGAAAAAARTVMADPSLTADIWGSGTLLKTLKTAALSDAPSVDEDQLTVSFSWDGLTRRSYSHRFSATDSSKTRSSTVTTQRDTVTVYIDRPWATALGKAVSGSDKLHVEASATVDVDMTNGSNW